MSEKPDHIDYFLDITAAVCPMTFVKTKLLIERMSIGEVAELRLPAGAPLANVPRSVQEHGPGRPSPPPPPDRGGAPLVRPGTRLSPLVQPSPSPAPP